MSGQINDKFTAAIKFKNNGKVDYTVDANMNLEKGLFLGVGFSLSRSKNAKIDVIYVKWRALNSHQLTLGTTRQGKTRGMASDLEQQIALGENVMMEEPKGSLGQEMIAYLVEYSFKHKREGDLRYVSPFFNESSEYFNPIYRYKNEQIASMIADIIEGKDAFYANIAKAIVLSTTMGLEFLEKVNDIRNPYDLIIMEKMEYAKEKLKATNKINKYIYGFEYYAGKHEQEIDIVGMLKTDAKSKDEMLLIDEAYERTKLRYSGKGIDVVTPLRTFLNLRDFAQFETTMALQTLYEKVKNEFERSEDLDEYSSLKSLGIQALNELDKISSRDAGFFSKVTTTYSTLMSDLITGDVGKLLNSSRINLLADDLANPNKGVILIVQPFPMIYKSASEALGKILFYMINSMAGYIGASGVGLKKRLYVNVDEAGSVLTHIVRELANKGGGLGFSLFLYTQSMADIEYTLESLGARILKDNMNNVKIYKTNDPDSLKVISEMLGTKKKATSMGTASDQRNTRATISVNDEEIASSSMLSQLNERNFILKTGSEIYLVTAPFVPDAKFVFKMPIKSLIDLSLESEKKLNDVRSSYK